MGIKIEFPEFHPEWTGEVVWPIDWSKPLKAEDVAMTLEAVAQAHPRITFSTEFRSFDGTPFITFFDPETFTEMGSYDLKEMIKRSYFMLDENDKPYVHQEQIYPDEEPDGLQGRKERLLIERLAKALEDWSNTEAKMSSLELAEFDKEKASP